MNNRMIFKAWPGLMFTLLLALGASTPLRAQHEGHGASTPSAASGLQTQAGPYRVEVSTDPAVIPIGQAKLRLRVTDGSGKPVEGAQVQVMVQMPSMKMGETEQVAVPQSNEPGVYIAPASFSMAGGYVATIKVSGPQGQGRATLNLQTGQNTATGSGGSIWTRLSLWMGVLALLAFVVYRMRSTGQRVDWRGVFSRPVMGGVAILLVMLVVVVFAVRKWRRPGAMTPLEAQGMEMSMPAPPGTAAVELATVRRGPVRSSIRYSGQAVGYIEQDVNSRVTGNLSWMPFYAGDRVRRGQLLARLDTSQIEPQIAQQRAAEAMARQNAITAQGQYRQALSDINRARAELTGKRGALLEAIAGERKARAEVGSKLGQLAEARSGERKARSAAGGRRGAVEEARSGEKRAQSVLREATTALRAARGAAAEAQSDIVAAREDKANAEADLDAAQSEITDAQAQLQAAQADQEYWVKEIARMQVLVKEGAVSKEEFQREQAQAINADTMVHHAHTQIEQRQAAVRGAESRIRRAEAMIQSAQAKAEQADATISGNQARIEQARADIVMAAARTRQMQAEAEGAGADISGAGARIQQMQEDVQAARAEAAGASARVQQVRSEIEAAQAGIRGAQAQAEAAGGGVGQARAGVQQAQAAVASTTTTRGYAMIRSLTDGVVTQRAISPGTLVQSGQAILKIAQINPIRLQANVAESDLKRVRVGSAVTIRDQSGEGQGKTLSTRVTSVAPSVDPQTRTGLVEAIVPNQNERFLPGEFVEMDIETGQILSTLSVPAAAIQRRATPTGSMITTQTRTYIWVAEPVVGQIDQWIVHQVEVRTGVSDGTTTAVLSGLREGQRVVTIGTQNLQDGDMVTAPDAPVARWDEHQQHGAVAAPDASAQTASITVTESGFHPVSVALKAGVPARITFTRKTEATCATAVVFPDFHIKKELPINQPVMVEFTPPKAGELTFGCGMDMMLRGKVVVK